MSDLKSQEQKQKENYIKFCPSKAQRSVTVFKNYKNLDKHVLNHICIIGFAQIFLLCVAKIMADSYPLFKSYLLSVFAAFGVLNLSIFVLGAIVYFFVFYGGNES